MAGLMCNRCGSLYFDLLTVVYDIFREQDCPFYKGAINSDKALYGDLARSSVTSITSVQVDFRYSVNTFPNTSRRSFATRFNSLRARWMSLYRTTHQ